MQYLKFKLRIVAHLLYETLFRFLERAIIPALLISSLALFLSVLWMSKTWIDVAHGIDPKEKARERVQAENEIMRTVAQVLGGTFVLAGLYFTGKNIFAERRNQMSDRFAKALESLAESNELRRLGAIHSLESLSQESSKDYPRVIEFLAQFIRQETCRKDYSQNEQPRADIQQALNVLGRRRRAYGFGEQVSLDFRGANLRGADLRQANFEGANFGDADLRGAIIHRAFLRGSNFSKAKLRGANLNQADLREVNFWQADLTEVQIRGARLEKTSFAGGILRNVSLEKTELRSVVLQRVDLAGAKLREARMIKCIFAQCILSGTELSNALIIEPIGLSKTQLEGAIVDGLKLPKDFA